MVAPAPVKRAPLSRSINSERRRMSTLDRLNTMGSVPASDLFSSISRRMASSTSSPVDLSGVPLACAAR